MLRCTHIEIDCSCPHLATTALATVRAPLRLAEVQPRNFAKHQVADFVLGCCQGVLRFASGLLILGLTHVCWPILREVLCVAGAGACYVLGYVTQVASRECLAAGRGLRDASALLQRCNSRSTALKRAARD